MFLQGAWRGQKAMSVLLNKQYIHGVYFAGIAWLSDCF